MHELPVMGNILKVVLKHARTHGVRNVLAVHLQVGGMSDLEDRWMQHYFDYLSQKTIARGARLVIQRMPVMASCPACGTLYGIDIRNETSKRCPGCGGTAYQVISGSEYHVEKLEAI